MVQLQLLGADGGQQQYGLPVKGQGVQLPDRSAENINAAQASMAQANQTLSQSIAITNETFANSALAAASTGRRRMETFNGVVGAIGEGVELYNRIKQSELEGLQQQEADALRRRVVEQVSALKDQFGQAVAGGMSEIEARNLMRDGLVALRRDVASRGNNLGGVYGEALTEAFDIVSAEVDRTLESRNQAQISQYEELRESALGVYQEQMSASVNPLIVRLGSIYTNPDEVQRTLMSLDSIVSDFAAQRSLTPIEALTLQRSVYQSANAYLTERGVRIQDLENQSNRINEAWNLVQDAYDAYYDPNNAEAYQQGRILESTLGVIENQYPEVELGRVVNARSPLFEQQQALETIKVGEALMESMQEEPSEALLTLSADAYNYLQYSYAFAAAFPGALQTDYSVAQVEALGRRGDNPVVQGWVEAAEDLRAARTAYTDIRNREVQLRADMARRQAQVSGLLDQLYPQRRGEFTTLNQQLQFLISVPEAAGVTERGTISPETLETYKQWYQDDIEAQVQILQNDALDLQSEWLPFGIDLSDPDGTARRLTEWGNRTQPERDAARLRSERRPLEPQNPNSPLRSAVPQGVPQGAPSFLQGQQGLLG